MRSAAALIFLMLLVSCRRESPQAPAQPPKPPSTEAASTATGATPVAPVANASAADPLAERSAAVWSKVDEWSGDGRVLDEARKAAMQLLEANRNYAPAYVALARIEYREGYINSSNYDRTKLARAWKLVMHALKLEPANREAHVVAGEISTYTGDFELAADHLKQARALPGEIGDVVIAEMYLEYVQGHPEQVIRIGRANAGSITNAKHLSTLHNKMAQSYERLGHADQAGEAYRAALAADPQSAWFHSNYASYLNDRGRYEEAVREAERALSIMKFGVGYQNLYEAYSGRIRELFDAKRFAEAGKIVEKVASFGGNDADAQVTIGGYYLLVHTREPGSGHLASAEAAFRRALAIDPQHQGARRGLDSVESRAATGR